MNAKIIVAGLIIHLVLDQKTAEDLKDYFDGEVIIVPPVEDEKGNDLRSNSYPSKLF